MTLQRILELTEGKLLTPDVDVTIEAKSAFSADLMSDVLHLATEGALLLTGLTHPQVIRTAEMADIAAIMFVRNKIPPPETIQLAQEKGVPLLTSQYTMFETGGRIYAAGLNSCDAPRSPQHDLSEPDCAQPVCVQRTGRRTGRTAQAEPDPAS